MVDVYTDFRFTCPAIEFAEAVGTPTAPVYRYIFSRQTEIRTGAKAAAHGAELPYVFGSWRNIPLYVPVEADAALSEAMMATWLEFAATGKATLPAADTAAGGAWPRWTADDGLTLFWDAAVTVEADEREARCAVWRELLAGDP